MSELEFESYLKLLSGLLRLSPGQRELIATELRDHMEERLRALVDAGMSREEAVGKALEEFGDAAALAANFRHIAWNRKRRNIMRWTTVSVCAVLTAILAATAFWPESENGPVLNRAVAQNNAQESAAQDSGTEEPEEDNPAQTTFLEMFRVTSSDERTAATREKLRTTRTDLGEDRIRLVDLIKGVAMSIDAQVYFDPVLQGGGLIDAEREVEIGLRDLRCDMLLKMAMEQPERKLGYYIEDGIIFVTEWPAAAGRMETRVYDCADLIANDPVFSGLKYEDDPSEIRLSLIHLIVEVTERSGEPRWFENGGPGTIVRYNDKLIISQTAEIHAEIVEFLPKLAGRGDYSIDDIGEISFRQ